MRAPIARPAAGGKIEHPKAILPMLFKLDGTPSSDVMADRHLPLYQWSPRVGWASVRSALSRDRHVMGGAEGFRPGERIGYVLEHIAGRFLLKRGTHSPAWPGLFQGRKGRYAAPEPPGSSTCR